MLWTKTWLGDRQFVAANLQAWTMGHWFIALSALIMPTLYEHEELMCLTATCSDS